MKRRSYRGKPKKITDAAISLLILLLGLALGAASRWAGLHVGFLAEVTSHIALWILLASAAALASRSPVRAGIHAFLLLSGMMAACYGAAELMGVPWPKDFLTGCGIAVLLSPAAGMLVWFAREQDRRAWLISFGVIAVQVGATILLFQKLRLTDLAAVAVTVVLLFWNKIDIRKRRRRRR